MISAVIKSNAVIDKIFERALRTTCLMRHACPYHTHFYPAQRSHQHQIIEVAQMANAENFISDFV